MPEIIASLASKISLKALFRLGLIGLIVALLCAYRIAIHERNIARKNIATSQENVAQLQKINADQQATIKQIQDMRTRDGEALTTLSDRLHHNEKQTEWSKASDKQSKDFLSQRVPDGVAKLLQ